jgi:glucokinase
MSHVLAGDIGGTKTDFGDLFGLRVGRMSHSTKPRCIAQTTPSLQALVKEFLKQVKTPVERGLF